MTSAAGNVQGMRCPRTLFASCLVIFSALAPATDKPAFGNVEAITGNRLLAHLQLIASDELEGRDTPSRGLNTAAKYIAAQLMLWGVKPAGDEGSYFQKMALRKPAVNVAATTANVGGTEFKYGDQFYAQAQNPGSAEGEVVYVGSGYQKPGDANDPYSKVDVKGKILLAVQGRPEGVTFRDVRSGRVLSPQAAALKLGARGVILITDDLPSWDDMVKNSIEGGSVRPGSSDRPPTSPTIIVKPDALEALLQGSPLTLDSLMKRIADKKLGDPVVILGKTAKFAVAADENTVYTQNVVAIVEGSDPKLKEEYVAVGAHYDHLGMKRSGPGDLIYNGADDDGSGTVSILEIAHAFADGPRPKRSILFVWHCGEEKGLWGSEYFTSHPTVPLANVVAQLNIDMIGRSKPAGDTKAENKVLTGPTAIYLVGTTRMSSELGADAKAVNSKLYNLTYDFTYDDMNNPERIFFRSDHYNYALHGIPILFWFDGVHEDYHQVGDEVQKIDFNKMEKVARTVYATAWEVANRKTRPKVDMPLPASPGR
ncbi:MAG: hypothetical protein QOJ65_1662 [Fimbriimonadaceae bacterium]|nr:hypothetical protein [Fimbriimonadaceae bacterium]